MESLSTAQLCPNLLGRKIGAEKTCSPFGKMPPPDLPILEEAKTEYEKLK
jgi:hypothetical protein